MIYKEIFILFNIMVIIRNPVGIGSIMTIVTMSHKLSRYVKNSYYTYYSFNNLNGEFSSYVLPYFTMLTSRTSRRPASRQVVCFE